ncbi:hypothetical protein D9757_012180 [Collybiopsis confluens]|uniref:NLE domain-containing protein n=1 Tax=Collybiopsis confluens TaxID=2823264 RepID=A0A8H5GKP2_9AGAR|nr:hypothetical protein D9757_012180 [Collybiopsis confluens]
MASSSSSSSVSVTFTTSTPYPLPSQKYMLPISWKRFHLSQLINKALSLAQPIPFDFLVRGELLRSGLGDWCAKNGVGIDEETLEIEYIESVMPPKKMGDMPHEDWVSGVSCGIPGHFLTASYDGSIRLFDYSQNLKLSDVLHSAPITSVCVIPTFEDASSSSHLIATSSHDSFAQITQLTFPSLSSASSSSATEVKPLSKLVLHTAPLSSVSSNSSGTHLLTSSWDGLIGVWDTSVPSTDEVPEEQTERKKKRKLASTDDNVGAPKRKGPTAVLRSHTARVSKVVFGGETAGNNGNENVAISCGFDSTVRKWDVERGVCTHTITASEKPFLDLALSRDGHVALAASTDRTVTLYDIRISSSASLASTSSGSFFHPSTPSCINTGSSASLHTSAISTSNEHQIITGAYDGIVRLWDMRSMGGAIATFDLSEAKKEQGGGGKKKVLCVDWDLQKGIVGVGAEGGLEVWKI